MARHPTIRDYPVGRDAAGKPLCRWCRGAVKPPRRTMCSAACVAELELRTNPNILRDKILKRDKGICAACGCDTLKIGRVLRFAAMSKYRTESVNNVFVGMFLYGEGSPIRRILHYNPSRSYWEADHILEVVRGGEFSLENMQTLCVPCHKQKTAKLARERAQERRASKARPLLENVA